MKEKKTQQKQSKSIKTYAVYSGIAFQMAATIGVGAFIGIKLDNYFKTSKPYITAGVTLFAVLASIYFVIKQLSRQSKKDNTE